MKVRELKELLKNVDDDVEVVMSSDAEGNAFSPLSDISEEICAKESQNSWEVYLVDPDDIEAYDEDECDASIVFWPTN